jgi:hypothetical protein
MIEVRAAGRSEWIPLPTDASPATISAAAIGALSLPTHDLAGNLERWWAPHGDSEVEEGGTIELVPVPNLIRAREVEVRGLAETRFRAPVGSAVPAEFLVRHVCDLMGVSSSDATVSVGDRVLGAWDLAGEGDARIVVTVR